MIEAVTEKADLKKRVFAELDKICKPEAIIASNTSAIMISDLATAVERMDKFISMHWFNPASVMKLIEIIRGALTSDETFNLTVELSKKIGELLWVQKTSKDLFVIDRKKFNKVVEELIEKIKNYPYFKEWQDLGLLKSPPAIPHRSLFPSRSMPSSLAIFSSSALFSSLVYFPSLSSF